MPSAFIPVNMQFLSGFWLAKRALKSGASHLPFYDRLLLFNIWFVCSNTVYPKKYAHSFCFAVLCCGYTLTDFPISIRLTSLALWQSNDCPSASKATLMNMDKYFMWIHYERLHNHNKAKHNKTVCIFLGIYCTAKMSYLCVCAMLWIEKELNMKQKNSISRREILVLVYVILLSTTWMITVTVFVNFLSFISLTGA